MWIPTERKQCQKNETEHADRINIMPVCEMTENYNDLRDS